MRGELSLEHIEAAAHAIDPVFLGSPQFVDSQLAAALGREVMVKVETTNPLGSFKGRGADFLVRDLESRLRLVCATAGNFGQGIAYAGRRHGLPVHVFLPASVTPSKLSRIRALDAEVTVIEDDEVETKKAAREYAADHTDRLFVEDGQDPRIAEGAGTIAVELLATGPIDTLVVQVGDGALITGIGRWIKTHSPGTHVVGVGPSGSPAMARSWEAGRLSPPSVRTPSRAPWRCATRSRTASRGCAGSSTTSCSSTTRTSSGRCGWWPTRSACCWNPREPPASRPSADTAFRANGSLQSSRATACRRSWLPRCGARTNVRPPPTAFRADEHPLPLDPGDQASSFEMAWVGPQTVAP